MNFDPKERQTYIGGSDVSAILGINPWKTKHGLYIEKTTNNPTSSEESEPMYWGTHLESVVLDRWNRTRQFDATNLWNDTIHPEKTFIRGHPDGIYEERREDSVVYHLIETKTTDKDNAPNWKNGPPNYYFYQLVYYAMLFRRDIQDSLEGDLIKVRYWFCVLIGGNDYREFRVDITDSDMDYVEQEATKFWENHVLPKVMPPYTEPTKEINAHLFPKHDKTSIEADEFVIGKVNEYRTLADSIKKLKEKSESLKEFIKHKIGSNSYLTVDGKKIAQVVSYNKADIKWEKIARSYQDQPNFDEVVGNNTGSTNIQQLR